MKLLSINSPYRSTFIYLHPLFQFYSLLTELWPFAEFTEQEAQAKIQNGERPVLGMENSTDPFVQVLKNAIHMSWTHDAR